MLSDIWYTLSLSLLLPFFGVVPQTLEKNVPVWLGVCGNRCLQRHWPGNSSPAVWGRSHCLHHRTPGEESERNRSRGEIRTLHFLQIAQLLINRRAHAAFTDLSPTVQFKVPKAGRFYLVDVLQMKYGCLGCVLLWSGCVDVVNIWCLCSQPRLRRGVETVCQLSVILQKTTTLKNCLNRSNGNRMAGWTFW